jgi:hypothetical protein
VNRPIADNDLLQACDRLHARMAKVWAFLLFASLGATWYLIVGLRAGGDL